MDLADAQRAHTDVVLQFEADADGLVAPGLVLASLLRDDRTVRVEQLHHCLTADQDGLRLVQGVAGAESLAGLDEELDESRVVQEAAEFGAQAGGDWLAGLLEQAGQARMQ